MKRTYSYLLLLYILGSITLALPLTYATIPHKEFLQLTVTPETIPTPGESTTIKVAIDGTCSKVVYLVAVLPPGVPKVMDDMKEDFQKADISWFNFLPEVKEIISKYEDSTTIWYRFGSLSSGESDDWPFPDEGWRTFLGDDEANTDEMGEYSVLVLGLGLDCGGESKCCMCCLSKGFDCARAPFFVVPEFMIGTIAPVLASLSGIGLYQIKKNRSRNE